MKDITGLGKAAESVAKIADSKLALTGYNDLAAPAAKDSSKTLVDLSKAFRLFLTPFQLAAVAQDRLERVLDRVRNPVPVENQIEAAPSIAGPVLQSLVFIEDDNPLLHLYVNLLSRAIDKTRVQEAHPAFAKLIDQLSPDEALILYVLHKFGGKHIPQPFVPANMYVEGEFPRHVLSTPDYFSIYLSHLNALELLNYDLAPRMSLGASPPRKVTEIELASFIALSKFGQLFAKACIPDDYPCPQLDSLPNPQPT